MTTQERSGWRDLEISKRHREWGVVLCATDLDFVLIEYADGGNPKAIIEYKRETAIIGSLNKPQYNVLKILAANSKIPLFIVVYSGDFTWFNLIPLNSRAYKLVENIGKDTLLEKEYVEFLFFIRDKHGKSSD